MPACASPPGSDKPTRLGVNPRRSHVPEPERKRCKTACNLCNSRRIRCSGTQPCDQCTSSQKACDYPAVDKKIYVPKSSYEELCANEKALELCLRNLYPDAAARKSVLAEARQSLASGSQTGFIKDEERQEHSPAASSSKSAISSAYQPYYPRIFRSSVGAAATEGSLLQDYHGTKRWLGGTSGATFLEHLKKFMHTLKSSLGYHMAGAQFLASRGQYQTSDSRLLFTPATDNNGFLFASPADNHAANSRLAKVDEFLQGSTETPTCGGIHYFGNFSVNNWYAVRADHTRTPELAFYEAALALGTIYSLKVTNSRRDGQLGETYFAAARQILGDPMDVSHYNMRDVATWAMLAMYMSEMNRRDNAYVYLAHAITICSMFGGLKGTSSELGEGDKRIIWTLFCLTRDLSCMMGRPPLCPLEAFQLPYPTAVPGLPSPDGLIHHIELSKITDYIVSNSYAIAPYAMAPRRNSYQDSDDQYPVDQVAQPVKMLNKWRESLPGYLQIPFMHPENGRESYQIEGLTTDRSLLMLHMKWNQLLILSLRPLFFLAVKSAIGADFLDDWRDLFGDRDDETRKYILECSAAARRNLWLGRHINEVCTANNSGATNNGLPANGGKLVMLDLHHIFNAAVVLLLYQMVNLNVVNTDVYGINEARRIFEAEARTECLSENNDASVTGYASDCLGVLVDLAALVEYYRPLRFKDSDHANTGIDVSWAGMGVSILQTSSMPGVPGIGDGGCSNGTLNSPVAISTEQLAANLNLESPYGTYSQLVGAQQHPVPMGDGNSHTNREEFQRWMQEGTGLLRCAESPLGGYAGL